MKDIENFIKSPQRNKWLSDEDKNVFIRKSSRLNENNQLICCFDIANINVFKQNKGIFTNWLAELINTLKQHPEYEAIFVESVINKDFAEYFRKRNWQETTWYPSDSINFFYHLK